MNLRGLRIEPALLLAPMEGLTDLVFRRTIRKIGGCGLTSTELVSARGLKDGIARELRMARFDPDEHPVAVQLVGRVPGHLSEAARVVRDLGADAVDLNMGCPARKVCAHSGGVSLMREPGLVRDIVRAVRVAVDLPVTVKMRAGWSAASRNAAEIASICEGEGADAVTVHWRTRADLFGGTRDLSVIAEVVERLAIPVVANGDVVDVPTALETLDATGAAGLMIGRGAVRNPWVFREVEAALRGSAAPSVTARERETLILAYFEAVRAECATEQGALGRWKRFTRYQAEGLPNGHRLADRVLHARSLAEALDAVRWFFSPRESSPKAR